MLEEGVFRRFGTPIREGETLLCFSGERLVSERIRGRSMCSSRALTIESWWKERGRYKREIEKKEGDAAGERASPGKECRRPCG
ncbi:unnamed protein product [Lactuca virosa]|uniref:Uncharacterized protein n=1 Tax=Lactuca virosa TaxID=75947 RepID=A0AAU9MJM3_9ASTR|nr:unnamed protein product [Lactuca virosa]